MGASSSLATRVHTASSYAERIQMIETAFCCAGVLERAASASLPVIDLNEQTDNSGHTLLMRIASTFTSPHHPSWPRISTQFLRAIDALATPNTVNRDGETILNILFHSMAAIQSDVTKNDEQIYAFHYAVASRLLALNRPTSGTLLDRLTSVTSAITPDMLMISKRIYSTPPSSPSSSSRDISLLHWAECRYLNVNHRSTRYNNCPLHSVVHIEHEQGAFQFLLLLLDAGVDLARLNEDGNTFLHQLVLEYESPSHQFDGARLKQVFDLLLQPEHALARGNWSQSGDCFRVNADGLTFLQLEQQVYSERAAREKDRRRDLRIATSRIDNDAPRPDPLTSRPSPSSAPASEAETRSWAKLQLLHTCCAEFWSNWANVIRPLMYREVELVLRNPEAVLLVLAFVDGQ